MTKKNDDKKPAKKPSKGDKPTKGKGKPSRGDTSPAEQPPKRRAKGDAAEAPPPAEPPPPTAPAPPAAEDSAEGWMDGRRVLEQIEHVLNGCPKPKEQPALAFVLLRGERAIATDERTYCVAYFEAPVSESSLKVTRASVESLREELKGSLNGAAKMEESALIRWRGLVAAIRRTGSSEEHIVLLSRFEGGPDDAAMSLEAPAFAEGSHATLSVDRLHNGLTWKGDGTAHLFVSSDARQVWIQVDVGGVTIARTVLAFDGSHLGIRQPTLPMDVSGRQPAAAPVTEAEFVPSPDGSSALRGLPAGLAWVRVECDRGAAWERLDRRQLELLSPFDADDVISWGPYPRGAPRVEGIVRLLRSFGIEARVVPCAAPDLTARMLVQASAAPVLELDARGVAGQLGALPAPPPPFPSPPRDEPVSIVVPAAIWDDELADAQTGALRLLDRTPSVEWRVDGETLVSRSLDAEEARTLGALLAGWGYRAAEVRRETYGDNAVTVWVVGRQGETGGAAL